MMDRLQKLYNSLFFSPRRYAGALPSTEGWMVFGMRLLLAVSALLTLYIGPDRIVLNGPWLWLIFLSYAVYSLGLVYSAYRRVGFRYGVTLYWIDVAWYGLMVHASGGASSPFFSCYFLAILSASFRHGFHAGARLTLGAALTMNLAALATPHAHMADLLVLRAIFVLALGYMIAFWGGQLVDQRRRLALLRDVGRLSNPRFGVQHTLESLMEKILTFYGSATCVLLMQDTCGQWVLYTAHHAGSGRKSGRRQPDMGAVQPLLDLGGDTTLLYSSGRAVGLAASDEHWRVIAPQACGQVADLLGTDRFISAPLPLRKRAGRIFITGRVRLRRSDASFLNHIVQQAFPVIETIDLLDRLASEAAANERQTIARDLHDSTIQPYIGLRHAVAAVRSRAGDDNPVAADLDRLVAMCTDVIGDMREFAHRLREARQEEPALLLALRRQFEQVRAFYDVDVTLDARAPVINDRMAAQVFQLVTEGVSNICKHTQARTANVLLAGDERACVIEIVNPVDQQGAPADFVPASIAERVQGLGGTLAVDLADGATRLRIRLPN